MLRYGVNFFRVGRADPQNRPGSSLDLRVSCILNQVGVDSDTESLYFLFNIHEFLLGVRFDNNLGGAY